MRLIDQESNSGKIIRALGYGIGIAVALGNRRTSYAMTAALAREIFGSSKEPKYASRYFSKLRKQKLIYIKEMGNNHMMALTERGQDVFLRFNYENMEIKPKRIWDGYFRMVIFDIPERRKRARDSLREKLKELGFVKFNYSVWVYPYPCQNEIDFIANYWGIGKYVHFALVKNITNREYLEKYFHL